MYTDFQIYIEVHHFRKHLTYGFILVYNIKSYTKMKVCLFYLLFKEQFQNPIVVIFYDNFFNAKYNKRFANLSSSLLF